MDHSTRQQMSEARGPIAAARVASLAAERLAPHPAAPSTLARPLSIAMIAPCPFPTHQGTQVMIRHLATALTRAGHDVHLVTYGYGEPHPPMPFPVHRALRIDAGLRSGPHPLKPAADAALMVSAARVIRAYRCDLMHVHNIDGLALGALLKLQASIPLVYHAHNAMGPELPTYYRAHFAQAFASLVGDVLDKTLPRVADGIITFDSDHRALHEAYGVPEQHLHIIPPGLDGSEVACATPEAVAAARDALGMGPWLLYAGNPDAYQNLELLAQALVRVRATRPEARLLVASNHPASAFEATLGPALRDGSARLAPFEDRHALAALFAVASLGVSPRKLWVGAPIKVLNYLAAGLPVVACRSGARHLLAGETAGLLTGDDADAFASAILEVLAHRSRFASRTQRVFERFRIDEQVASYERVYASLLPNAANAAHVYDRA